MNKNTTLGILALIVLIGGGLYLYKNRAPKVQVFDGQAAVKQIEANDRTVGIEEYVKRNIAGLSAEAGSPGELGGTHQVTAFEASGGKGVVSYEDGHNAYTADFTYSTDSKGVVTIKTFVVRKK